MFGYFYNSSIRRYVVLMGALFNHIEVKRGEGRHQKVPISFGSKERFITKLHTIHNTSDEDDSIAKVETVLPRMHLSIIDIIYNPPFKTNITNRDMKTVFHGKPVTTSQFNPVPFKFMFELGIYTRHEDDVFQIVEQILPYFQPRFNCKVTELHTNEITIDRDIPITIQSLAVDDMVDGDRFQRRTIQWSIIFELDGWMYPPAKEIHNEIKTVYVDFFANTHRLAPEGNFESVDSSTFPSPEVTREDWDGRVVFGYSSDTPIPAGDTPSGPRGSLSGIDKE